MYFEKYIKYILIVLNDPETTLKENLDTYILQTGRKSILTELHFSDLCNIIKYILINKI